jgi:hypothetical protein
MRNVIENLLNFTGTSNLYCVWVPVQGDGRGGLAAIWIDRAMTAFTADGTEAAANCFTGQSGRRVPGCWRVSAVHSFTSQLTSQKEHGGNHALASICDSIGTGTNPRGLYRGGTPMATADGRPPHERPGRSWSWNVCHAHSTHSSTI